MTEQDNKNQGIYNDNGKQKIINLIILDKSGSMSSIAGAAIMGFNKTIEGIREAQERYKNTQEHYVSLLTFCNCAKTYVYENVPVAEVAQLTSREYRPCCGTPLYDAMGMSLSRLLGQIQNLPNATAAVTVITDGLENSSHEYSGRDIKALVERLQNEEGWNFAYIGTNQDVEAAAASISIKQTMYFEDTSEGMNDAWEKERKAKNRYFSRMDAMRFSVAGMTAEEKKMAYAKMNHSSKNYEEIGEYAHRFTPNHIDSLQPNQIFVFGSNSAGAHYGGAARTAVQKFGAIMGQGEGLQGRSYAIPTMGTMGETEVAVQNFIAFAKQHPELTFLVTQIGCGIAGYTPHDIAPMFMQAIHVENIWLPKEFWNELI